MAQLQHAQPDIEGIVPVAARQIELGAATLEMRHQIGGPHLELELVERLLGLQQHGGDHRHRQHRHQAGDLAHDVLGQPADDLEPLVLVEAAQIAARRRRVAGEPVAGGDEPAEIHAGIAETIPAAAQHQAELAEPEGERGARGEQRAAPRQLLVERAQQGAVLEHAVVVQRHRHEDDVVVALGIERFQHVVEQAELGLAQLGRRATARPRDTSPAPRPPRSPCARSAPAPGDRSDCWSCGARSRRPSSG